MTAATQPSRLPCPHYPISDEPRVDGGDRGGSGNGGIGLGSPPRLRDSGTLMWEAGLLGATPGFIARRPPLCKQPVEEAPRGAQSSHLDVKDVTSPSRFDAPFASVQQAMRVKTMKEINSRNKAQTFGFVPQRSMILINRRLFSQTATNSAPHFCLPHLRRAN